MKILVSSISSVPGGHSEAHVGWTAACALAKHHDVWLITNPAGKDAIETLARTQGLPERLHPVYHGILSSCSQNRLLARFQSWVDYIQWNRGLLPVAEKLHREIGFDLVHHITYTTWRVACPLWRLGIPLVWGPLGGGEHFPAPFFGMLSLSARIFERVRRASGVLSSLSPAVLRCAREAAHIFGSNEETMSKLARLRGRTEGISRLSGSFFPEPRILRLRRTGDNSGEPELRIFAGGNLEGRKGVALALQALARARKQGLRFRYFLGGSGPERAHLEKLAAELGIADAVTFSNGLRGDDYIRELQTSHIYLLPSLRDNAPLTLMEAMLAGCVPIVAACGGPKAIVAEGCGFAIPVTGQEIMIEGITAALLQLNADRTLLASSSEKAHARIAEHYSEAHYLRRVGEVYARLVTPPS